MLCHGLNCLCIVIVRLMDCVMVAYSQPNSDCVLGAADASGSFVSDR